MMEVLLAIPVAVVAVWLAGDFFYSRWAIFQQRRWERKIRRESDGVREGCREFTVGQGDNALLMIHGFGDTPAIFRNMAGDLAARGFACRVMHLPGTCVPLDQAAKVKRADWTHAVNREISDLKAMHKRIWIVGHSMGGTLAIRQALEKPRDVQGLILLAPLVDVAPVRSPLLSPRQWHTLSDRFLLFTRFFRTHFPLDVHDPSARSFNLGDDFIPRPAYAELFGLTDRIRGRAKDVQVPVFMVLARGDKVVSTPAAEKFFGQVASREKELIYAEHSGHVIPLDNNWRDVNNAIVQWIERNESLRSPLAKEVER